MQLTCNDVIQRVILCMLRNISFMLLSFCGAGGGGGG